MNIPDGPVENCIYCTDGSHTYDERCRPCFIRSIAHMPVKHRGALYTRITLKRGTAVMTKVSDEVGQWYKKNHSWGTYR